MVGSSDEDVFLATKTISFPRFPRDLSMYLFHRTSEKRPSFLPKPLNESAPLAEIVREHRAPATQTTTKKIGGGGGGERRIATAAAEEAEMAEMRAATEREGGRGEEDEGGAKNLPDRASSPDLDYLDS